MNTIFTFCAGIVSGLYIAQNYNVPNVKIASDKLLEYLKSLEKND